MQNGTGTVNLRATVSNSDRHFWPGQFVNVRLVLSTEKGAVLIPSQATQISQKGRSFTWLSRTTPPNFVP